MNEVKLLQPRPESVESGLCLTCPHSVVGGCDTRRPCGQVLACRAQARAVVVGRFPTGRVRQRPPKRLHANKNEVKTCAWKETYERMKEIGDSLDCVWIQALSRSQQVSVRRFIKSGKMSAVHVDGVLLRGMPVTFVSVEELDKNFEKWEADYGRYDA